jgi:polysaccharide biosynthesis protein PslH
MNILQIASKVPYPLYDGGAIGIYNISRFLALRGHKITFLTFSPDRSSCTDFEQYCQLFIIREDKQNKMLGVVKNIFSKTPYTFQKYYSKSMIDLIDDRIRNNNFDIVHIDHLHLAFYGKYIKEKYGIPVVLREHNFETLIWERLSAMEKNFLKKIFYSYQYKKVRKYEPAMCEMFDKCLMVTNIDKDKLLRCSNRIKAEVVPAGVDVEYFKEKYTGKTNELSILFIGSLDWFPNIDAFSWFYEKIFPEIIKKYPTLKLYVVGKKPPSWISNIKNNNLIICGMVEDVREYIDHCEICVVPLRIGGGMRIKILEMFAMKKAIVSTSVGCEGIEVKDKKHLLIANTEKEFIDSISIYLEDKELKNRIGINGFNLVNEIYRWDMIAKKLEEIYLEIKK